MNGTIGHWTLISTALLLFSCGGGGGSGDQNGSDIVIPVTSGASALEGVWRSGDCAVDGTDSSSVELSFSGSNFTQSFISYIGSTSCSSDSSVTFHVDGTINLPAGTTQSGDAQFMDIFYQRGYMTASSAATSELAAQGLTLQDAGSTQGISDINNIPVNSLVATPQLYTIYAVTGNTMRFGTESPSFDGSIPALRHAVLDPAIYNRVGSVSTAPSNTGTGGGGTPVADNSPVIGVVFDPGELETSFDFQTGLSISNLVGGGAYMVLQDGTAISTSTAPVDFDFQNVSNTTTLAELGLSDSAIFPPLNSGYTFDFFGEDNTPGAGGPTFRSVRFTSEGTFQTNNTTFLGSNVSSTGPSPGTYSIAGNSIQLNFNNGEVVRTLFATDGTQNVILGQRRFRAP